MSNQVNAFAHPVGLSMHHMDVRVFVVTCKYSSLDFDIYKQAHNLLLVLLGKFC